MITNNEEGDSESNHYYGNISEPDDYPELYNRPFIDVNSFNFSSSSTKMKSSSIKTTIKTKSNNLKMSDKRTPLHHACLSNNVHDVQQLIASHAPLDEKDELCRTPLHLACWQRHCNIARILIQAGADFNALDIRNNTPMHLICFGHWLTAHKCYVKLVLFLIDCGADLEVINKDGHYPLDFVPDLERRKLIKVCQVFCLNLFYFILYYFRDSNIIFIFGRNISPTLREEKIMQLIMKSTNSIQSITTPLPLRE